MLARLLLLQKESNDQRHYRAVRRSLLALPRATRPSALSQPAPIITATTPQRSTTMTHQAPASAQARPP